MTQELIIRKDEVDWLKIIELALKKDDWGKKYILYKYDNTILSCVMESYNFVDNRARFRISLSFDGNKNDWGNYEIVEYAMSNFTIEQFKSLLNKKILKLIQYLSHDNLKREAEIKHEKLKVWSWTQKKKEDYVSNGLGDDYNKLHELQESPIREELLEVLQDKLNVIQNKPYKEAIDFYMINNELEFTGKEYIMEDCE